MKTSIKIIALMCLLSVFACGRKAFVVSSDAKQDAQNHYDSGFLCLQQDSLLQAFPHFIQVAEKLEVLPDDMTDEEKLLVSRAYYQMAHVFRRKIETNAEIDALRWALNYQRLINDTVWMARTGRQLADAFESVKENDSARFYLNKVMPCLDTLSDDVWDYIGARHLLADLYFDDQQLDSCLQVKREIIAFKTRRGMDTKNDSVSMGMNLFFSGSHAEAKPYLRKALEAEMGEVERGAIMSLLEQIYEEEGQADSVAFCHGFNKSYVQAESERVSDGMLAVKQYERYKKERDARLQGLREQKQAQVAQRKRLVFGGIAVLVALLVAAYLLALRKRHRNVLKDKDFEALELKVMAIYGDRLNNKKERIVKVFDEAYPDAIAKLKAVHPDLNATELDISVLSMFSFRTKEVADLLGLRENTVSKYRSNIKKKTQSDSFEALWKPFLGQT